MDKKTVINKLSVFHGESTRPSVKEKHEWSLSYRFFLHQHPYVQQLIQRLIREGVRGLQDADTKKKNGKYELYEDFFEKRYRPSELVEKPYPVKDLDFSTSGAYSVYNWELFYHVPLTIAIHLSKNGRYAEAQKWFHYIFDPTDDSDGPTPERFWKVKPFQTTVFKKIEEILKNLSTEADRELFNDTVNSIKALQDKPFRPHVVARYRQQAYMLKAVMAYLDNLIAWGDSLFRQDTPESVDEALQIYIMAANILGPRPQEVPIKHHEKPLTYAQLKSHLDEFGNALVELEADLPFDLVPSLVPCKEEESPITINSIGQILYFCVPMNNKLFEYWDIVADRLFKIRNSLDIHGRFRRLPLFSPPIDPALLARAAAAGVDVGTVVSGLNQPLPLVRFTFLVQKALEITQEVKSLGNQLLLAMEKEDNEALSILRAKHERAILEMAEHTKYAQWQEAKKSREALEKSLALAVIRYMYYEQQLGRKPSEIEQQIKDALQALGELDKQRLEKMQFSSEEPGIELREIEVDIARDLGESGGKIVSSYEREELAKTKIAHDLQIGVKASKLIAQGVALIPGTHIDLHYWGVGTTINIPGGEQLATFMNFGAEIAQIIADDYLFQANRAAKIGSYARRQQEWAFQSNLAAGEINQILKQLRAAQIREAIAEQELKTHRKQIEHAKEIERFLNAEGTEEDGKKTNRALYAWMKREVRGLYNRCFELAFDVAKKAERALQHELGDTNLNFIRYDYQAGKEGLLAGEKLYLDLKRMEMAYHENNRREYEMVKHVSLLQVDPMALIQLRTTGRCIVRLPEELFDFDAPGQYFRRIKSVAVTIPCVTGPYAGVNCKLTLSKSSIRKKPSLSDDPNDPYARQGTEDPRFDDYYGAVESIVTSTGQNDSGLFETNLRDERYLPFENAGVISEWLIELPANPANDEPAQFDYNTITDVILHIRYTAREGGEQLRQAAITHLKTLINKGDTVGSVRLFSIRHEFPTEWAKFKSSPQVNGRYNLVLHLRPEHYPFWSKGRLDKTIHLEIIARADTSLSEVKVYQNSEEKTISLEKESTDIYRGKLEDEQLKITPTGEMIFSFETNAIEDLWIGITWGKRNNE